MKELTKEDIEWMRQDGSMAAADALVKEIGRIAAALKIERETLIGILHQHSRSRKLNWQAKMWRSATSRDAMYEWAFWYAYKNKDGEEQLIKLEEQLPALVRKTLIAMAKMLPAPKGGKPTRFDWLEEWQVRARVRAETEKGITKKEAYARVAGWYTSKGKDVSVHTIRRICEPKERERTRLRSQDLAAVLIEDP